MPRATLPKSVMILGREFSIKRKKMSDFGHVDKDGGVIWIRTGLTQDEADQTLLHECIHAILYCSGVGFQLGSELEESIVRCLDNGLWLAGFRKA